MVKDHSLFSVRNDFISVLHIPLHIQDIMNITSPVQATTLIKYESENLPMLHLSTEASDWDHRPSLLSLQEDNMFNHRRLDFSIVTITKGQITTQVNAVAYSQFVFSCIIATDAQKFGTYLESCVQISQSIT